MLSPGFAGHDTPCAVFLRLSVGYAALVVDIGSGMCADFACADARRAVWVMGFFHVLQHGEVYTVDASSAWTARAHRTWNLDIILQPLHADRYLAAVSGLHEKS